VLDEAETNENILHYPALNLSKPKQTYIGLFEHIFKTVILNITNKLLQDLN
jgi:hypothetical protein